MAGARLWGRSGRAERFLAYSHLPLDPIGPDEIAARLRGEAKRCQGEPPTDQQIQALTERAEARLVRLGVEPMGAQLTLLTASGGAKGEIPGLMRAVLARVEGGWALSETRGEADGAGPVRSEPYGWLQCARGATLGLACEANHMAAERIVGDIKAGVFGVDEPVMDDRWVWSLSEPGDRWREEKEEEERFAPLWGAARRGCGARLARELLALGADPNAPGPGGLSPLAALAASLGRLSGEADAIAQALLEAGADPLGLASWGQSEAGRGPSLGAARARLLIALDGALIGEGLRAPEAGRKGPLRV